MHITLTLTTSYAHKFSLTTSYARNFDYATSYADNFFPNDELYT
jgi:hypothetical protein